MSVVHQPVQDRICQGVVTQARVPLFSWQVFITPYTPEQNGMVERVIRMLKEQCAHRQRFETLQHASRVIGDWIQFYNQKRPHQALKMKTPAQAYAEAA